MRIRDIVADLIGVIAIFGIGYGLLLIGHSMGWPKDEANKETPK